MHSAETLLGSPVGPSRARRYFAVALLMLAFACALPATAAAWSDAPSITVDTPAAGSVWAGSDTQTVAWTLSYAIDMGKFCVWIPVAGNPDMGYFVEVLDAAPGQTSYSTNVTVTGVPPGDGYQVSVQLWTPWLDTWDPGPIGHSGSFTMQSAGPTPAIRSLSPKRAMVGKLVIIRGTNFGAIRGYNYVLFGKTEARIKSWSATQIRVVVPAGAHAGRCAVTVRDANRASKGVSFTVTAPRGGDAGLVGSWHDNSLLGWSEMYKFTAAGTFAYVIANTDQISKTVGSYRARGDKIRLFNQWSDGRRVPNVTLTYSYRDWGKTLIIGAGSFRKK